MKSLQKQFVLFSFLIITFLSSSITDLTAFEHSVGAEIRVRGEGKDNSGFISAGRTGSIGERARVHLHFKADSVEAFIQPQFTKVFGQDTTLTTGATQETSGTTFDTDLSIHQAYAGFTPSDIMSIRVGRLELAYGDHLIIGNSGWSNTARSFDAIKAHFIWRKTGWTDLFYSSISDKNVTNGSTGNYDFLGMYNHVNFTDGRWNIDAEPYLFYNADFRGVGAAALSLVTLGGRAKFSSHPYDIRSEATYQIGKENGITLSSEQWDVEVGYTLNKSRIALEYFSANDEYRQLFPTTHKWLGISDLLGRRNIQGGVLHLQQGLLESLSVNLDGHLFLRVEDDKPIYSINVATPIGTGTVSGSLLAGNEEDLYLSYKYNDNLSFDGGASLFVPLSYIEDEVGNELASFYYLQGTVHF